MNYWIPMIRNAGGQIKDIFFFVDRLEEGIEVMKNLNLEAHALVPLNEHAWNYLLTNNVINEEIYRSLRVRIENKEEWARKMLKSEAGIKQFILYLRDEKMRAKAKKVLEVGYPNLKEEILERLKQIEWDIWEKL